MRITFPKFNITKSKINPLKQKSVKFSARCQESSFKLRDVPNLHCPVCGLVMLDKDQRKNFIDDVSSKTGESLIKALTKYEDETTLVGDDPKNEHKTIYRPAKAKIIEVIKQAAKQNPNLNLLQLVRLKKDEFLAPLIKQQLDITFELEEYLETVEIDDEERKKIKGIIEEYKSRILGESEEEFKRKDYIHALSDVTENALIQQEITKIIEKLPQSTNDVSSFFVKYGKDAKTSREIASKFVNQSGPSTEHLKPKSKGGKNNINNYIVDCADCNSERCNTDFNQWLEEKPELGKNLQKYVNQIQEIIDNNNFSPIYDNYVEEIIHTLNRLSYGKLILKTPKSKNKRQNDSIYQRRLNEVEKIKDVMRELARKKEEMEDRIQVLEEGLQFADIAQLEEIEKQKLEVKKKISKLNKNLADYQKNKNEARQALDENTMLHIRLAQGDESAREKTIELDEAKNKAKYDKAEADILKANKTIKTLLNKLKKLEKQENVLKTSMSFDEEADKKFKEATELKVGLEIIEDIMKYNENILKLLRNFKDMSSLQFQEYISMVFY